MNDAQKQALEALVGRALTPGEITAIEPNLPEPSEFQAARRDDLIAALLSTGRTKVVSHFASERGILERYPHGPLAADALLSKLEAFASAGHPMSGLVARAVRFLRQPEGLDIGSAVTQSLIAQLAANDVITSAERDGLKAMATVADPISVGRVSDALNAAEGRLTLGG